MSISVFWHDKQTITMVFEKGWAWHDFDAAAYTVAEHMEGVPHDVDMLFDLRAVNDLPTEGLGYYLPRMMSLLPENGGQLLILGASEVVRTTFTIFARAMTLPPITFIDDLPGAVSGSSLERTG